jgi:hypothetical protein
MVVKICPACGKSYPEEANFCPRATCASSGKARRLVPLGLVVPEGAKRNLMDFPRKPGADDSPERLRELSQERSPRRRKTQFGHFPVQSTPAKSDRFRFDSYFQARKPKTGAREPGALKTLTPTQLALHLSGLLKAAGVVDVSSWPITGSDGADLLFSWQGKRVVISVKDRAAAASGRVVQVARAARDSYGGQGLWLVTTSQFKPSVHAMADEPQLLVLDGDHLAELESIVARQLRLLRTGKARRR